MRILIICSQYPPDQGGGGSHTFYLAAELAELGSEVHVLTGRTPTAQRTYRDPGKPLTVHRVNFFSRGTFSHRDAVEAALKLCRKVRPDIVHGQHFPGAHIALRLKAAFGIPLVLTLHKTPEIGDATTLIQRDDSYSEMRFLASTGLVYRFVAGSIAFRDELLLLNPDLAPEKVTLILHGVAHNWLEWRARDGAEMAARTYRRDAPGDNLIICPARLDRRKNLELFVRAAAKLVRERPAAGSRFLITGKAKTGHERRYQRELEELAAHLSISQFLTFRDFNFYELPAVLRSSSVCVLPSNSEGLGLAVLEALALGVPTVATATKGITEVIPQGRTCGLLFERGNWEALGDRLIELYDDRALRERLSREGRRRVKTAFSGRRMAKDHLNVYETLVHRHCEIPQGVSARG